MEAWERQRVISGGIYHSLALKDDGSIVSWGDNDWTAVWRALGSVAASTAAFEGAKALVRGLETGGVVAGGSDQIFRLGDGREDEAVVPLNQRVLSNLGNQIAANMSGGGGGPQITQENHYHYSEKPSPSQVAKKNEQQLKKLGVEWGLQA